MRRCCNRNHFEIATRCCWVRITRLVRFEMNTVTGGKIFKDNQFEKMLQWKAIGEILMPPGVVQFELKAQTVEWKMNNLHIDCSIELNLKDFCTKTN